MWGLTAPLPAEHDHHGVVLILAMTETGAIFVSDDGGLHFDDFTHLRLEWRFNWNTHVWEDETSGELNDETGDGGPEVSGDIPEPDGPDRSDTGDEGHGAIGSVDSE